MPWLRIERWVIVLATIAASAFAFWNMVDEIRPSRVYAFSNSSNWGYAFVIENWFDWSLFPVLNALLGLRTSRRGRAHTCVFLAIVYAYFYSHYAFNGSSRDRMGAQQMHIMMVPILSGILFGFVHLLGVSMPPIRRIINRPFRSA